MNPSDLLANVEHIASFPDALWRLFDGLTAVALGLLWFYAFKIKATLAEIEHLTGALTRRTVVGGVPAVLDNDPQKGILAKARHFAKGLVGSSVGRISAQAIDWLWSRGELAAATVRSLNALMTSGYDAMVFVLAVVAIAVAAEHFVTLEELFARLQGAARDIQTSREKLTALGTSADKLTRTTTDINDQLANVGKKAEALSEDVLAILPFRFDTARHADVMDLYGQSGVAITAVIRYWDIDDEWFGIFRKPPGLMLHERWSEYLKCEGTLYQAMRSNAHGRKKFAADMSRLPLVPRWERLILEDNYSPLGELLAMTWQACVFFLAHNANELDWKRIPIASRKREERPSLSEIRVGRASNWCHAIGPSPEESKRGSPGYAVRTSDEEGEETMAKRDVKPALLQMVEIGKSFEGFERTANKPDIKAEYFQQPRAFVMDAREGSRGSDDALRVEVSRQHEELGQVFTSASRGYGWLSAYWHELLRDKDGGKSLFDYVKEKDEEHPGLSLVDLGFTPSMIVDVILTYQACLHSGRESMRHHGTLFKDYDMPWPENEAEFEFKTVQIELSKSPFNRDLFEEESLL